MQSFENPFLNPESKKPFWDIKRGNSGYEEFIVQENGGESEEHVISIPVNDPELEKKKEKLLAAGWKIAGQGEYIVFEKELPKKAGEFHA